MAPLRWRGGCRLGDMDPAVNPDTSTGCTVPPMGTTDSRGTPTEGPRGGKTTVTKSGLIRTVVYLHWDERRALKLAAAERDVSGSDIMRAALREYLGVED